MVIGNVPQHACKQLKFSLDSNGFQILHSVIYLGLYSSKLSKNVDFITSRHTGILSCFLVQIIYLHYLTAPRGARGVKRTGRTSGSTPRSVFALIFSQNWMNCKNTFKFNKNCQNMPVFWCYFEFYAILTEY